MMLKSIFFWRRFFCFCDLASSIQALIEVKGVTTAVLRCNCNIARTELLGSINVLVIRSDYRVRYDRFATKVRVSALACCKAFIDFASDSIVSTSDLRLKFVRAHLAGIENLIRACRKWGKAQTREYQKLSALQGCLLLSGYSTYQLLHGLKL